MSDAFIQTHSRLANTINHDQTVWSGSLLLQYRPPYTSAEEKTDSYE